MTFQAHREPRSVEVSLPFSGRWKVENSPKRQVPSHGTNMLGTAYVAGRVAAVHQGEQDHEARRPLWRSCPTLWDRLHGSARDSAGSPATA